MSDIPTGRARARHEGARFYVGTACSQHPTSPRYTVNARCVECAKADRRNTYSTVAGKAKDAARKRAWRAAQVETGTTDQFADLLG